MKVFIRSLLMKTPLFDQRGHDFERIEKTGTSLPNSGTAKWVCSVCSFEFEYIGWKKPDKKFPNCEEYSTQTVIES